MQKTETNFLFGKMIKNIILIKKGKRVWKKLCKKNKINTSNEKTILFLSDDEKINFIGLQFISLYVDGVDGKYEGQKINILSTNIKILHSSKIFDHRCNSIKISDKELRLLIKYASFITGNNQFIIMSLNIPHGRDYTVLIGKDGLTIKQLIVNGIYNINLEPTIIENMVEVPVYHGNDQIILDYLEEINKMV